MRHVAVALSLLLLAGTIPAGAEVTGRTLVVHESDFEAGLAAPEWSRTLVSTTPSGRGFLGPFDNHQVNLTLRDLVEHTHAIVEFDLYLIDSWDGAGDYCCGPDEVVVDVGGVGELLRSTFSNTGCCNKQHYPHPTGGALHAARTGALESNTLGYPNFGDTVYRFRFEFAHDGDIELRFRTSLLQRMPDEGWGLDNVRVSLAGGCVEDTTPPVTVATVNGLAEDARHAWPAPTVVDLHPEDPCGVASTAVRVDGGEWQEAVAVTLATPGTHIVEYGSIDRLGNVEATRNLTVLIDDAPPQVALTRPTEGTLYLADEPVAQAGMLVVVGPLTVRADATDELSGVDRVEFFVDGELVASDATAPYSFLWESARPGPHTITARAVDAAGNAAEATRDLLRV